MGAVLISNLAASDAGILLTVTVPCQLLESQNLNFRLNEKDTDIHRRGPSKPSPPRETVAPGIC